VNLGDSTHPRQQEAVGILGVNLIYAAHHAMKSAADFLARLFDELNRHRVEIDCIDISGPAFATWDRQLLHAELVAGGYAEAVVFPDENHYVPANELLYKRALVLAPGRFDSVEQLHAELIRWTLAALPEPELKETKGALGLFCLSTAPGSGEERHVTAEEIVEHVVELRKLGYGVMLFRARELYTMSAFVNRYTKSRIHFAIGLSVLVRILQDNYQNLAGNLLEGIARLFSQNVRLSVYPMATDEVERRVKAAGLVGWRWKDTNGMVYANDLFPGEPLVHLYQYLLSSQFILIGTPSKGEVATN
jgi:hypothetical protein